MEIVDGVYDPFGVAQATGVEWTVDDPAVAAVIPDETDMKKATLELLGEGQTSIRVKVTDENGSLTKSWVIQVDPEGQQSYETPYEWVNSVSEIAFGQTGTAVIALKEGYAAEDVAISWSMTEESSEGLAVLEVSEDGYSANVTANNTTEGAFDLTITA